RENDVSLKTSFGAKRRKKVFAACGGEIFFGYRHLFPDFAKQIRKKMSTSKFNLARSAKKNLFTQPLKRIFGAKRRKKPFYTTPNSLVAKGNRGGNTAIFTL
ncbi:MAG: hypothetical protein ACOYOO_16105, partial [Saprospiraceae bacterium]